MNSDRTPFPAFRSEKGAELTLLGPRTTPSMSRTASIMSRANVMETEPASAKDRLRQHVVRAMAPMMCAGLEQFLCAMFRQDHVLSAYFRRAQLGARGAGADQPETVLPFDVALAAARRAWNMPVLLRHERHLVSVAALCYPCAVFHAADPSLRSFARCGGNAPGEELLLLRQVLLEDPLRALRARDPQLAAALGAALGFAHSECEADQIARLVSSVRLATIDIEQRWAQVIQ